ncbi:Nif3-like dinuclear metal center hexameric protein [Salinibacterium sp. SWN1162]|uniref:Nif3-like dinuclear metal center hexameric protein n=1 Tax=Salinibacterium sp. SWN1162 TaxID=2792053 RepID=UPI0018CD5DF5|nr:Nif3-like dinuclear metal center hexameric protein [Salinibacterium sp. SWN1162]MBH0009211.1 Nif3-like dinuclear metal center hexameric protein [Salinibacterium sp. SWN1162]
MSTTVAHVIAAAEQLWPVSGAEAWDAVGLVSGDLEAPMSTISLAVDAVLDTVDEAIHAGADMLITHHPLLLRGVTSVASDRYKGAVLTKLIRAECALLAAHTNADVVETGTSGRFATKLGLSSIAPIVAGETPDRGIGRTGQLPQAMTLGRLARLIGEILPPTATGIRVAGDFDQLVNSVALCGGAGDAYLNDPAVLASDVYITSDLRHHPASEARENARLQNGPALIDVSHWASEWLWLDAAADELRALLPDVTITVSELRTDPWDFAVVQ